MSQTTTHVVTTVTDAEGKTTRTEETRNNMWDTDEIFVPMRISDLIHQASVLAQTLGWLGIFYVTFEFARHIQ